MKFTPLLLEGTFLIEPELIEDDRGFFARSFCVEEFARHGLNPQLVQCNISFNKRKNTLRGMHFQVGDKGEEKLIRCTMGTIYDVLIDLRPQSKTYKKWISIELTAKNRKMLYVPKGLAHGFQTLEDNSEVFYQMSAMFAPEYARGVRWNDPTFSITWPTPIPEVISDKDRHYQNY